MQKNIYTALAAEDIKSALMANPLAFIDDGYADAEIYWRLVALVATQSDAEAVSLAVVATLTERIEQLVAARAEKIADEIEESEAREKFDRDYAEAFFYGGVQ